MFGAESVNPIVLYGSASAFFVAFSGLLVFAVRLGRQGLRQSDGQQKMIDKQDETIGTLQLALTMQRVECDERITGIEKRHRERLDACDVRELRLSRNVNILIGACHAAGIQIPESLFDV